MSYENVPPWIREIPEHLKTQEMCDGAVCMEPYSLEVVPDRRKTREMCNEAVGRERFTLYYVPDRLKTQEMCDEAVCAWSHAHWNLQQEILRRRRCA